MPGLSGPRRISPGNPVSQQISTGILDTACLFHSGLGEASVKEERGGKLEGYTYSFVDRAGNYATDQR